MDGVEYRQDGIISKTAICAVGSTLVLMRTLPALKCSYSKIQLVLANVIKISNIMECRSILLHPLWFFYLVWSRILWQEEDIAPVLCIITLAKRELARHPMSQQK